MHEELKKALEDDIQQRERKDCRMKQMHSIYSNAPNNSSLSNWTRREEKAKESGRTIGTTWEASA